MAGKELERVGFTQLCLVGPCINPQDGQKSKRGIQVSRALVEAVGSASRALCLNLQAKLRWAQQLTRAWVLLDTY